MRGNAELRPGIPAEWAAMKAVTVELGIGATGTRWNWDVRNRSM
ncbi:hypothetical protein ACFY93_20545 [Streptomyces sp. NPDC008313]